MTIAEIMQIDGVQSANEWKNRIYINLNGNGGSYRGEKTAKIWVDATGKLNIQYGKGMTSSAWTENLHKLEAAFEGR